MKVLEYWEKILSDLRLHRIYFVLPLYSIDYRRDVLSPYDHSKYQVHSTNKILIKVSKSLM